MLEKLSIEYDVKRVFIILFVSFCLSGVFYFPDNYTDRFFTSGMIWMGMVVGSLGIVLPFVIGGKIKFSGLVFSVFVVFAVMLAYMLINGNFALQQVAWGITLCLFLVMVDNCVRWVKVQDIYFILSLFGLFESFMGLGQYAGLFEKYHSSCVLTGTFENPAGLTAYLSVCFPAMLYFTSCRSLGWKVWGWIIAGICVVTVVLSGARTGMIALLIIAIVFGVSRFNRKNAFPVWIKITGILVCLFIGIGLYLLKKDSADGRVLIWRTTGEMFCDAPWVGQGPGAFSSKYMNYQAAWLVQHPDESWVRLADLVKHPFNEYLKIGVEYGIIGLICLAVLMGQLWRLYKSSFPEEWPLYGSLLVLGICSLFSYPLNYPSIFVLLFLLLGMTGRRYKFSEIGRKYGKCVITGLSLCLLLFTLYWKEAEEEWYRISYCALEGKTEEVLPDYKRLYPFMRENPLFLYNYGAELHEIGEWKTSAELLEECRWSMDEPDVRMLLAHDYFHLKEFGEAERHYLLAARMCPNRFLPFYYLVKLYQQTGRKEEALEQARKLIVKPVKVPSFTINRIKQEMNNYVNTNIKNELN